MHCIGTVARDGGVAFAHLISYVVYCMLLLTLKAEAVGEWSIYSVTMVLI